MTKIAGGAAGRFCQMARASGHTADGFCHVPRKVLHMEKEVRGVAKSLCHVKKLLWNAVFGAFMGPWKTLKPSAGAGFEGFRGTSSQGRELFHPGAARRLPRRLSCHAVDCDGRRVLRKQGLRTG